MVRKEIVTSGEYFEPFVGAGSVLFELSDLENRKHAFDIVEPLIDTYQAIRENPIGVWAATSSLGRKSPDKETYLQLRNDFNRKKFSPEDRAALFIYLNHACYNGLWRTNKDGEFNVPFGDHKKLHLPDQADFLLAFESLSNTSLRSISNPRETIDSLRKLVKAGDVVFADPPYLGTFDDYDEFDYPMDHFHEELASTLWELHLHGATIIAMNADQEKIRKWYGAFCKIESIERFQGVAGTHEGRGEWNQILATTI